MSPLTRNEKVVLGHCEVPSHLIEGRTHVPSPPERPTGAENRGKNKTPKKDRTHWLYIAVIIAVVAGIVFGIIAPDQAKSMEVVGTMFVSLVKMIIAPVIFCTIVLGIGSVRAAASVGKAGGIALAYFVTIAPERCCCKVGWRAAKTQFLIPWWPLRVGVVRPSRRPG